MFRIRPKNLQKLKSYLKSRWPPVSKKSVSISDLGSSRLAFKDKATFSFFMTFSLSWTRVETGTSLTNCTRFRPSYTRDEMEWTTLTLVIIFAWLPRQSLLQNTPNLALGCVVYILANPSDKPTSTRKTCFSALQGYTPLASTTNITQ